MVSKKCEVCGTEIVILKSEKKDRLYSKKFCSTRCRSHGAYIRRIEYYKKYSRSKNKGLTEIICEICGKKATVKKSNCKVCSVKCSHKAWKKRNTEKVNSWQREWFKKERDNRILKLPNRVCRECDNIFSPSEDRKHTYKIYCSTKCRMKFNSRKQTKRRNEILKNPSIDPVAYEKHLARKKVQDANYKALKRGCTRDDENHISLKSWLEIKKNYGNKCAICGIIESEEIQMTIDHIYPISKGGKNNKENIQPLCWSCNSKKQATVSVPHTSQSS